MEFPVAATLPAITGPHASNEDRSYHVRLKALDFAVRHVREGDEEAVVKAASSFEKFLAGTVSD